MGHITMSSILTNMSAMSAVTNLAATQKSLADTQNQISTGLAVSSAKDNAAYWSIATNMRTQNNDLATVTSSLNLGASVLGTATSALTNMLTVLQKIQSDVVSAQQSGTDSTAIQADIAQLQTQLTNTVSSASFNGVNVLNGTTGAQIVASVSGNGASVSTTFLSVTGEDFSSTASTGQLVGVNNSTNFTVVGMTQGQLSTMLANVGSAISNVQSMSATIGATQKNIDIQSTFVTALSASITTGIGSLVDADMNAASTRLSALQTQQQLGIQALSVANQNSQLILKLFQ